MSELHHMARRKIIGILEKHGISDEVLESELMDACWEIRSFQERKPDGDLRQHPAIRMVEKITMKPAPRIMYAEIIRLCGETPDFKEYERAYTDWVRAGRDLSAWTWLKWAHAKKPKAQAPKPTNFVDDFGPLERMLRLKQQREAQVQAGD